MLFSRKLLFVLPLVYLLIVASMSAILAYVIHLFTGGGLPFSKLTGRGTLLLLVLSIYPAMKLMKLDAANFNYHGINTTFFFRLVVGFGIGVVILGLIVTVLIGLNIRMLDLDDPITVYSILPALLKSFSIGLLVACLEEPLFRGLLLSGLLKYSTQVFALTTSAFYYALLHFLRSDLHFAEHEFTLFSGFSYIIDALSNPFNLQHFDSFLALFLAGVLLGLVRIYCMHGLAVCIGLHAGWVFIIKTTKALTDTNRTSSWSALVGDYDGVIGYLSALLLVIIIIAFLHYLHRHDRLNTAAKV